MPETAIAVRIVENKSVQTSEIRMKAGFRLGACNENQRGYLLASLENFPTVW